MTARERCRTHTYRLRVHAAARVAGHDACADATGARRILNATYRAAYRRHATHMCTLYELPVRPKTST